MMKSKLNMLLVTGEINIVTALFTPRNRKQHVIRHAHGQFILC